MGNKIEKYVLDILNSDEKPKSLVEIGIKLVGEPLAKKLSKIISEKGLENKILETMEGRKSFREILKYIESPVADEFVFNVIRSIFVKILTSEEVDFDSYNYLLLAKSLSENELRIVFANYKIFKEIEGKDILKGADTWLGRIAEVSGLKYRGLVYQHEKNLEELGLIGKRRHADLSGISNEHTARLTDFGIGFCEYVYDESLMDM